MGKKQQNTNLGKAIIRKRFGNKKTTKDSFLHTSELNDGYEWGRLNLQSVTEQSNLDDFLATAELAGTEFTAEKLNVSIIKPEGHTGLLSAAEEKLVQNAQEENKMLLSIPKRPEWDESTTPEELDRKERESFLQWRRNLAELQEKEHILLTPFERNLDFWRQLWRVIERSDVVVQIVDARNPLLFYCEDLSNYVGSKGKASAVLINKSDYLTEHQRNTWQDYLQNIGLHVAFWSAFQEAERNKENNVSINDVTDADEVSDDNEISDESSSEDEDEIMSNTSGNPEVLSGENEKMDGSESNTDYNTELDTVSNKIRKTSLNDSNKENATSCRSSHSSILNGNELIDFFKSIHTGSKVTEGITTIGLIGYPNVGKSSTINALLQTKKVPVSATPGRTKHFQTLYLDETTLLCDCPGLVMPTFVSTKADMIVSGILPIDQMRDFVPPISLVCRLIPKAVLEATYGIILPTPKEGEDPNRPPTAHELAGTYGLMRGFMTHKGVPDFPRSARCILKDFVNGKLLYCHQPPGISKEEYRPCPEPVIKERKHKVSTRSSDKTYKFRKDAGPSFSNEVDKQFFKQRESTANSKGKFGVSMYARQDGFTTHHSAASECGSQMSIAGKHWKKHGNKGKKEKLRRVHRDLDVYSFN